jgi:hypothetical protein
MSQHAWYVINSWLASRTLIDGELLADPRIHTCEDLYVALQIAQRTFLAFSGEVTMHHCYRDESSTVVDAHRHLDDTLRGAVRHWSRLLPAEAGHGGGLMPVGRGPDDPPEAEATVNIVGRLIARRDDRRLGGAIAFGVAPEDPLALETEPIEIARGACRVRLLCERTSREPVAGDGTVAITVRHADAPRGDTWSREFPVHDLDWRGALECAELEFDADAPMRVVIGIARSPSCRAVIRALSVTQAAPVRGQSARCSDPAVVRGAREPVQPDMSRRVAVGRH